MLILSICLSGLACVRITNAQDGQIVPTDDPVYGQIERLQRRGYLLTLDPATLPYRSDQIADAVALEPESLRVGEKRSFEYIRRRVTYRDNRQKNGAVSDAQRGDRDKSDRVVLSSDIGGSIHVVNTQRLEQLRPLDTAVVPYQSGTFGFGIAADNWLARVGVRHDGYYDRDPDALDSVNRLAIRSEHSYVGYRSPYADAFIGRFASHWAPRSDAALFVSDNPRPYDVIRLRIGSPKYYLESVLGELDSSGDDGTFTGRVGDGRDASSRRRFLSAHKFVWRPNPKFMIGIQEAVLYSGQTSGFSLKYLSPVTALVFEVDNTPKNDENNGMIGGLIWFQIGRTTASGQLFFDDLDLRREGNGFEPPAFSLAGSVVQAAKSAPLDFGSKLEVVTARNYAAPQPEGRYIYLLRGLGTQFSDYVMSESFADIYLDEWVPGLQVRPSVAFLWQGELDIRADYPDNEVAAILVGTVERTIQPAIGFSYLPDPHGWIKGSIGLNRVTNKNHVQGSDTDQIVFSISAGIRFTVNNKNR